MPRGRRLASLTLTAADRAELEDVATSTSLPQALALRARMILASCEGLTNADVARKVGASPQAVGKWRKRYLEGGIESLRDEPRPGRPRTFDDEKVAQVIKRALQEKPPNGTRWSTPSMGAAEGVSASTVSRWFRQFGVKPLRAKPSELPTDPLIIEKVLDITGLYLNPPDHAMVLCAERQSQIQAFDRTQSKPPVNLDGVEGYTHDCLRHGTTTLCAALDVATGKAVAKREARHQAFLSFLRLIDEESPMDFDLHLVLDSDTSHKHVEVKAWLAERPRYHLHFAPTYSSWLNESERWFGLPGERAPNRGRSRSVRELMEQIQALTDGSSAVTQPFVWAATARSILAKSERPSPSI